MGGWVRVHRPVVRRSPPAIGRSRPPHYPSPPCPCPPRLSPPHPHPIPQSDVAQLAAQYEHRLQEGQKAIFHLEAFVAQFMSRYKNWQVGARLGEVGLAGVGPQCKNWQWGAPA